MNDSFLATAYRDSQAEYRRSAHAFTSLYARDAWRIAQVPAGASVLDIACGTGSLAFVAAAEGARVLAIDYSPGMVDAVKDAAMSGVDAYVMDGQALDLPSQSFDAAFSLFGIMLFPDWRRGLAEMFRIVRPGGSGSVTSWRHPGGAALNLLLAEHLGARFPDQATASVPPGMAHFAEPDRFAQAMSDAGFVEIAIHEVTHDYVIEDRVVDDLESAMAFNPMWQSCSDLQRDDFRRWLIARLEMKSGSVLVPCPALIALGKRP